MRFTKGLETICPHPCGYFGDPARECRCSPGQVERYRANISGPLLDRIDIHVEAPVVEYLDLATRASSEPPVFDTVDGVLLDKIETENVVQFGTQLVALEACDKLHLTETKTLEPIPGRQQDQQIEVFRMEDPEDAESQLLLCRSAQRRLKEAAMISKAEGAPLRLVQPKERGHLARMLPTRANARQKLISAPNGDAPKPKNVFLPIP